MKLSFRLFLFVIFITYIFSSVSLAYSQEKGPEFVFSGATLHEVIDIIFKQLGKDYILEEEIARKKVFLKLSNQDYRELLEIITKFYQFDFVLNNGVYYIGTVNNIAKIKDKLQKSKQVDDMSDRIVNEHLTPENCLSHFKRSVISGDSYSVLNCLSTSYRAAIGETLKERIAWIERELMPQEKFEGIVSSVQIKDNRAEALFRIASSSQNQIYYLINENNGWFIEIGPPEMAQKAKAIFDKDKETVFKTVNEITRENNGDKE